ncbi:MAG TPA: transcriptional regulator [Blastocatellia bacterium]|nr:transcriptional regulator [Blastocatellia bacterium]
MTAVANRALNSKKYGQLLAQALPKAIETEKENERALQIVNGLMSKGESNLTVEEDTLLNLLVNLIEKFEAEHYHLNASTPRGILLELMEARNVQPRDLWEIFGSKGTTSEVISGKRGISKAHARALADYFDVSTELFI